MTRIDFQPDLMLRARARIICSSERSVYSLIERDLLCFMMYSNGFRKSPCVW